MTRSKFYEIVTDLEKKVIPYSIATIVKVTGSVPRHLGAKMIVTHNETFDTIGGGAIEHMAINDAREQLRLGEAKMFTYSLDENSGQCCGGSADVFIEPILPIKKIVVFGAGHIAEELVPMLKKLKFNITLVDERSERISLKAFDIADTKNNKLPSEILNKIEFNEKLYIIVLTHTHVHDKEIVEFLLDKPLKYLGLIGSRNKWELFKKDFKEKGYSDEQIKKVVTPIGLDIGAETPFEIAVSIIAEIIKLDSKPKGFNK